MSQTSNTSQVTPPNTTEIKAAAPEKVIFRKTALERLSSPEQLDYLMSITSPVGWLALSAVGVILFFIALWGVLGRVPDKVSGRGILIRGGAVLDVSAGSDGFIMEIFVKPGDRVVPGMVIASVNQSGLDLKIALETAKLRDLQAQDADITAREEKNNAAQLKAFDAEKTSHQKIISDLTAQAQTLVDRLRSEEELQKRGLTTQNTVITARENLFSVQRQISESNVRLSEITSDEIKIARETQEKRNQRRKEIDESARQLKEYSTERDWGTKVVCLYRGRVLEKLVERGNPVAAKDRVATVETEEGAMQAVVFVPAAQGKKVASGLEIQISPSTVKPEEYGFILGKVTTVSFFPSTPDGMKRVLRNEQLVKELSQEGAPIEVTADLITDPNTRSGYKWSSSQGPPISIFSGTLCSGSIVVDRKPPVEYVIPKIKETLGIR